MTAEYRCRIADWNREAESLRAIRTQVFVVEQNVPQDLEWDEYDAVATHFVVERAGSAVATGRLKTDGQVGRMAVLAAHRGRGVGGLLLRTILEHADAAGCDRLWLHAQVQVIGFYARCGFEAEGEEFLEAGIRHRTMVRNSADR